MTETIKLKEQVTSIQEIERCELSGPDNQILASHIYDEILSETDTPAVTLEDVKEWLKAVRSNPLISHTMVYIREEDLAGNEYIGFLEYNKEQSNEK